MRCKLVWIAFFIIVFICLNLEINAQTEEGFGIINVSLSRYYYIVISDKLWAGIFYTNETGVAQNVQYPLLAGSGNNSAVWNYNKSNGKTEYWIYYGGNTNSDICHGATHHLCSRPGCIGLDNVLINISNAKWSASLTNDFNNPSLSNTVPFIIGFDNLHKVYTNLSPGTTVYLRYWLDVPPASAANTYSTTYQIRVVPAGEDCV
jgi:hypothetical protein